MKKTTASGTSRRFPLIWKILIPILALILIVVLSVGIFIGIAAGTFLFDGAYPEESISKTTAVKLL